MTFLTKGPSFDDLEIGDLFVFADELEFRCGFPVLRIKTYCINGSDPIARDILKVDMEKEAKP